MPQGALRTCLAMVGKFFASSNLAVIYMWVLLHLPPGQVHRGALPHHHPEHGRRHLLPHVQVSLALPPSCRLGGAIPAPYIALYLPDVTSYLVMGGAAVLGGAAALLLPETLGFRHSQTFTQISQLSGYQTPWRMWRR